MRDEVNPETSFAPELDRLSQLATLIDEKLHVGRALEIARSIPHAAYDCLYLAAAEARGDVVVTADGKLTGKLAGTAYANLLIPLRSAASL